MVSAHPQILVGEPVTRGYKEFDDHQLRILLVPMDGSGQAEEVFSRHPAQSAHSAFCPADGNLLYFDLDLPPHYWGGGDGKTPRVWLLDLCTGQARPLKEDWPSPFATHTVWLWDGSALAYHGSMPAGGIFIGIADTRGRTIWERVWKDVDFYGHLTADPKRPALVLDGDFSRHRLQWLHYADEPADASGDAPCRIEPICIHGTEWRSLPGQYSHPHPLTDPAGRWISFTKAAGGRSDVCVVDVS